MVFPSPQLAETLNRIVADAVESKTLPSHVFGTVNRDGETHIAYAGPRHANDASAGSVNKDTIFWICSSTKMVTTIAALQLLEQGKITLDTLVSSILPEIGDPVIVDFSQDDFPTVRPAATLITFKHLLNHTSGLSYDVDSKDSLYDFFPAYAWPHDKHNPIAYFLNTLRGNRAGLPLKFEPGTDFTYGFSTDLVGFIIERITGKTLEEYFKDHIFAPLGITSMSFYLTPDLKQRKMQLQVRSEGRKLVPFDKHCSIIEQDPEKVHLHLGGDGLYSSVKDYLAICQHLLQILARTAHNPILTCESVQALFEPTLPEAGARSVSNMMGGRSSQWSLGLCINNIDLPGMRTKGTGSWGGWAGTSHLIDPHSGIALVSATQLIPVGDQELREMCIKLEKAVYADVKIGT